MIVGVESQHPCNYAVWEWSKWSKKWLLRGRFATPQAAADVAGETMIVIDVVSDRQIWWRGAYCSRQKPHAVPALTVEKYDDHQGTEASMMFTWEVLAESGVVIGTVRAKNRRAAKFRMRRDFYTGVDVRLAAEQDA